MTGEVWRTLSGPVVESCGSDRVGGLSVKRVERKGRTCPRGVGFDFHLESRQVDLIKLYTTSYSRFIKNKGV